jgi:hypothetical protein
MGGRRVLAGAKWRVANSEKQEQLGAPFFPIRYSRFLLWLQSTPPFGIASRLTAASPAAQWMRV